MNLQKTNFCCNKYKMYISYNFRPSASPGYWLCGLLPLALIAGYFTTIRNQTQCPDMPVNYKIITIVSVALSIQTISFYIYLYLQAKLYKWLIVFIPFISGTSIFKVFLNESWTWSLIWTLSSTIFYQRCYILVMRNMPMSFTYGEASIIVQGLLLFAINSVLVLNGTMCENASYLFGDLPNLNIIMMVSVWAHILNVYKIQLLIFSVCFTLAFGRLYFIGSFQKFAQTVFVLPINGDFCYWCYTNTRYEAIASSFSI